MAGGSGSNNEGNELSEVVRQLAVVAQQLARNSTNNGDAQGELFKKVAQSKPLTYQGKPDPTILENWLREFEKLFGEVGFPNLKVGCATYYLRGEANLWWKQNEATTKALHGFNWTMFQENVFQESVATEKAKSRKFESGLTTDLQLRLCGQVFKTLDEVYGRSAHLYALELKKKKELAEVEGKEKRKDMGQNAGNPQGGRNFNGGPKNSNQGNNKDERRYFCKRCRNNHPGKDCEGNLVTCRACNKLGHREYECFSKNSNRNKQSNNQGGAQRNFQGNKNYAGNKGAQQNGVKGNNNGNNQVKSRAPRKLNRKFFFHFKSHYFKAIDCLKTVDVIDVPIVIPTGGVVQCTKTLKDVPLKIKGKVFLSDLIEFGLSDFDIILGMDWLSKYSAEIRCRLQKVQLSTVEGELVTHWKHGEKKCPRIISMIKLAKYIKKGHPVYFCSIRNLNHEETTKPENIESVNEFLDVFLEEIPGMPPKWEMDFTIELVLGKTPISKEPYRMEPAEMSE
ncbi:uncharacterized protein LOC110732581 [Chenopodium quinoa]|uniref:uncharacterized protein LOC110732581 n=1 Tax=Chenopodium quinoa TaxID=63459 RepID=UPI000B7893BC|nr:uncharacterized protein LOC110732581 [Chenopodium quinoa]